MTTVLRGLDEVRAAAGTDLGHTPWVEIGAERVAQFDTVVRPGASASAAEAMPALFLVSLTNLFMPDLVVVEDVAMGVNYGTGEIRFPAAAPVPARLRCGGRIVDVAEVAGGAQTTIRLSVEAEGVAEPVCVVDALSRWLS